MERKNTDQLQQELMTGNDLDRVLADNVYLHQVFSGRRTPSRNRLLCLCFGLGASVDEAQDLLRHARLAPLYSRDRRDAIVIFGLSHNMTLGEINDKLYAEDADTLC